jgi:hypothetical protein
LGLAVNSACTIDWSSVSVGLDGWRYIPGSNVYGSSNITKHVLGVLFLFCFALYASQVVSDDAHQWLRAKLLYDNLPEAFQRRTNPSWFYFGPLIKCQVIIVCCVDTWLLVTKADGPKDVVLDILGLAFLFNLDTLSSVFVFLSRSDWPADAMGQFQTKYLIDKGIIGEEADEIEYGKHRKKKTVIYRLTGRVITMFVLILPLSFIFVYPTPKAKPTDDITVLQQQVVNITEQLKALQVQFAASMKT